MDIKKYQTGGLLSGPIQSRDYVPLPYAQAFEMSRLTEADRDAKGLQISNMYKNFYDTALQAPPSLQDDALAEYKPYLDQIERGLAEAGGDPLKYRGGMDVMRQFQNDLASGRIGSLQRAGTQYATTKKEYDKLNNLYMEGKGGVSEATTNLNLQLALQGLQNSYDAGQPAIFSPGNLVPEVDVLEKTGSWLSQKNVDGFTDAQGNKIEKLTAETLLPMAKNYMMMDDGVRGTVTQEIDLNMAAGNYPIENADMDKLLKNPDYNRLYSNTVMSAPPTMSEEDIQNIAAQRVYRSSLIDDRMNNFAVAAIQPFLQSDVTMKEKDTKLTDIPVGGSGSQRPIVRGEKNIADIRNSKDNLLDLQKQRNAYAEGTPQYNELNEQVTFIEDGIASKEKALKTYAKDLVTTKYSEVGNSEQYEEMTEGLSSKEKEIANLLAVTETAAAINIAAGGGMSLGTGATSTQGSKQDIMKNLRGIVSEYQDIINLDPNIITLDNAGQINQAAKNLQTTIKKIETAKEYEQNIRTLNPDPAKGEQDAILNLRRQVTDAAIKDAMKFVDPATGGDLLSILKANNASLTPIAKGTSITTPGVEIMPTASFVNGKQLYAVSFTKQKWKEGEPRQGTIYVTEAGYSPEDQTNKVNYLAENLLKSNNAANRQLGAELIADNTIGGLFQRTEIEYANADQRGELPGYNYAGEVSYADRPVSGVPGVSSVRRVSVGGGQYDYYILDANGDAYIKGDKSGLLTSRSVLDLGRLINQEYGKR